MAEQKTKPTDLSVTDFLNTVPDAQRRADCFTVLQLLQKVTQTTPKMWGGTIVGFGEYHYKYDSGHEGGSFVVGFSPRKQKLTLYLMGGLAQQAELLKQLGKHKTGKSCLYINKLADVNLEVLKRIIEQSNEAVKTGKIQY